MPPTKAAMQWHATSGVGAAFAAHSRRRFQANVIPMETFANSAKQAPASRVRIVVQPSKSQVLGRRSQNRFQRIRKERNVMKIAVAIKVVPDDQDIQVAADGSLDYSKAKNKVSEYDRNAIEAAAQLAAAAGDSKVYVVTVGGKGIDDSKTKKDILARGADELFMIADDAAADLDANATAAALADLVAKVGDVDVIVCGDGSADNYAQQVDVQLAAKLGLPSVNGATKITPAAGSLTVVRALEDAVETVEIPTPCVVAVVPDIAVPRIAGMKDILAAGKKPMDVSGAASAYANTLEVVDCKAPEQAARACEIVDAGDEATAKIVAAIKAAL
jgi:electron transfer flavoprotein beta subunit